MRYWKLLAGIVIAVVAFFGIGSYWIYSSMRTPVTHTHANDFITIEKGSAPAAIVDRLAAEGILPGTFAAKIYLRTFGNSGGLKAGEYQFASPITPLQVFAELEKGEERTVKLTIPEGFTRFDIAKRIAEKFPQTPPADEKQVLLMMEDVSMIADLAPNAKNLEGFMYPSTYNLPRDAKPAEIIKTMVDQFKKVWKPEWTEKARQMDRTPSEIVTIASLVETESGVESERPVVASVIYNRLAKSVPLGIDMTNIYIAKMQNRWDGTINKSDLDVDSPYNTRRFAGLPPGPISSVSESALSAALNPASTDYLYYVRNVQLNDGSHWFYASAAAFEKGKAEYQVWLEKERAEKRAANTNQ